MRGALAYCNEAARDPSAPDSNIPHDGESVFPAEQPHSSLLGAFFLAEPEGISAKTRLHPVLLYSLYTLYKRNKPHTGNIKIYCGSLCRANAANAVPLV
jgi:hypothetical protein